MHIKELKINRYKSITDKIIIQNFSNLHILVGPNNAGKTNILDALNLFFDPETNKERFEDKDTDIDIVLEFQKQNYSFKYNVNEIFGDKEKISQMQNSFIRIQNTDSIYNLIPQELKDFKKNYPKDYVLFSLALREYFKDIEISEKLFVLSVHSDSNERPIKRMGSGFKRLFVILFYIFHPQYKIILIDEPELHLHPSIIRRFLLVLAEKKLNNQIFLTTHHPTFIQADYLKHIWRVARNKNNSTSVYCLSDPKIDFNRFIQEINDDNSGIFFCDKVLLVEGVSDYIFMKEILKKFYKKEKDIKVIYTGGKGTVDLYSDLCDQFKIPYAIMLDRDALHLHSLSRVKKYPLFKKEISDNEKIKLLKEKEIFILDGSLENVYPPGCKIKMTKPLTALHASKKITKKDLSIKKMFIINEILEKI